MRLIEQAECEQLSHSVNALLPASEQFAEVERMVSRTRAIGDELSKSRW